MRPAGIAAFEGRKDARSGIYSYEQESVDLSEPYLGILRGNTRAWEFFEKQPATYRRAVTWWVASAKQEKTRLARLEKLVGCSANAERVPQFTWKRAGGYDER